MPRRPTRRSSLAASVSVAVVLAGCGGKLQGGALGAVAGDAATQVLDDAADGGPLASSQSDDAAAASNPALDGAPVLLLPPDDASLLGAPSPGGGGIDPNGPCPAAVGSWQCPVEGARLCGAACSMQCFCTDGFWLCHLPPC
jgi:hypothetical protein